VVLKLLTPSYCTIGCGVLLCPFLLVTGDSRSKLISHYGFDGFEMQIGDEEFSKSVAQNMKFSGVSAHASLNITYHVIKTRIMDLYKVACCT
jgi:hypothetical protein